MNQVTRKFPLRKHDFLDEFLGCTAQRALFFDDRPRNVDGAKQVGIDAHVFESAKQARAIVERGTDLS